MLTLRAREQSFFIATLCFLVATGLPVLAQQKESVRQELVERQKTEGYLLVDYWRTGPTTSAVSPLNRTSFEVRWIKPKADRLDYTSPTGTHELIYRDGALILRNRRIGKEEIIAREGYWSEQCWSPDGREFVFSSEGMVRIYSVERRESRDLVKGEGAAWSPDGRWIAADGGRAIFLIDPTGSKRKKLRKTKGGFGLRWSPDSRFLSFTRLGGSTGGFLFWGIECIEPYRVWVSRMEDGDTDWVLDICKPPRSFVWVKTNDVEVLSPAKH